MQSDTKRFEALFGPHLGAAYNLALWLTGTDSTAKDVVQESCLRAFRFLHRFAGGNARAWLLAIVRNQSYTWLKAAAGDRWVSIGDDLPEDDPALAHGETPEHAAIKAERAAQIREALAALPPAYREVIILKDLEDMAYKDIATVIDSPLGTVMSRLARARSLLRIELLKCNAHD